MRRILYPELPFWFWLLLGFCLSRATLRVPIPEFVPDPQRVPYPQASRAGPDPRPACPRELRSIPGVGQQRALAIAQARWAAEREGLPFVLENVSGIGPALARQIAGWTALSRPGRSALP